MKKTIFQNFKIEINYFKYMEYCFNTVYFLRHFYNFNIDLLSSFDQKNQNILYLNYKDLISKENQIDENIILEKYILNKKNCLFLLDFKEASDDEFLLFLISYFKSDAVQKNPIVILNKPKKIIKDEKIFKTIKVLNFTYYLILKYGIRKKIIFKELTSLPPRNNSWYILGFSILNLFSFIFMALFGSSTQYVQMNALLESMTYFMNDQPENSRIHAVYNEHFESSEEKTSREVRNKYSILQKNTTTYGLEGTFNSYFIPGSPNDLIEFDVKFKDYANESYNFKTKIIGQHVYSNQNRILMEKIHLEQYLIKKYQHHMPLEGASSVYYMPSNIADELIKISENNDFKTYSDFIGKLIVVSHEKDNAFFEQTMSINNIFYTSNNSLNIGEPLSEEEYINTYSGKDKGLGKHILNTIDNFGVSTSLKTHDVFGSVFCLDFFGHNKALKMMLEQNFATELENNKNYLEFFYLNKPISEYGLNLNMINDFYRDNYNTFTFLKFAYLTISLLSLNVGATLFYFYLKLNKKRIQTGRFNKGFLLNSFLLTIPFVVFQLLLLFIISVLKHNALSISLMNIVGSPFSLLITVLLFICLITFTKKDKKIVYKIKI